MKSLVERSADFIKHDLHTIGHSNEVQLARIKAAEHKKAKDRYGNRELKWDSARKCYMPLSTTEEIEHELQELQEISIRTIGLATAMMGNRKYTNQAKQVSSRLKQLAGRMGSSKEDDERWNLLAKSMEYLADYIEAVSGIGRTQNYTTAVGSVGADRSYKLLKKLEKRKSR